MSRNEDFLVSRRDALCGGGASVLAAMIAALLGDTKPVRADTISGSVPEIDALAVQVVVDSYQFAVAPGSTLDHVVFFADDVAVPRPAARS